MKEQKYKLISKDLMSFAEVTLDYPPLEYETAMSNLEHRNRACPLQRTHLVECDDNGDEIEESPKRLASAPDWGKEKEKLKYFKCGNCGGKYEDCDGDIGMMTFKGKPNIQLCHVCGKRYIALGAIL